MSWNDLDPQFRQIAEDVLTDRQLQALKLAENDVPFRTIALNLGITVSTAFDTVKRARQKVADRMKEAA